MDRTGLEPVTKPLPCGALLAHERGLLSMACADGYHNGHPTRGAKGIRTPDLLNAMQADFVGWCRSRSRSCRSEHPAVRVRRARSGGISARCHLVSHWVSGPPLEGGPRRARWIHRPELRPVFRTPGRSVTRSRRACLTRKFLRLVWHVTITYLVASGVSAALRLDRMPRSSIATSTFLAAIGTPVRRFASAPDLESTSAVHRC
jgi:hypothetical protein